MTHLPRILITAGPTYEPIDRVRFIGNRSSGRMGLAIARAAAEHNAQVTLLLGPVAHDDTGNSQITVHRFQTTADLQALLHEHWPRHDLLIMAAAVSDYRPKSSGESRGKLRRTAGGLTIELESTPDLLAEASRDRLPGQFILGFALEPADELARSARDKLKRKDIDAIVANPLETMDSQDVDGALILRSGEVLRPDQSPVSKESFADWLIPTVLQRARPACPA